MNKTPDGWKTYDDFAAGIATNRLPASAALAGRALNFHFPDGALRLRLEGADTAHWEDARGTDSDWYEAINIHQDIWFIDLVFASRPLEALSLIFDTASGQALGVRCRILSEAEAGGMPRVAQDFLIGKLGETATTGEAPQPTRDLIGLRALQTYSPNHTYEHTYLNAQRYAWQCLNGVQRGQGDVDLASYYRFAEGIYVFTFREFLIPVASVFVFDYLNMRSTGKFLGITGAGAIENNPAGAFMQKISQTFYPAGLEPV